MYKLRPYQQEAVDIAVPKLLRGDKPFIELLATGAGKSLVIASIASRLNGPVLVLQPSKEILEQNFNKLLELGIRDAAIYSASFNSKIIDRFTYATIGSIKNYALFAHFKYVIVDECFPYDQRICTDQGHKTIGYLSKCFNNPTKKKYILPKVLSYNESTKGLEYKQINKAKYIGIKETITLHLSQSRRIRVTSNHPFLTNKGWINAGDLQSGDFLISTCKSNAYYPLLNCDQKEILKGSILGDGHLDKRRKTPNTNILTVIHGEKQKEYCHWKANMFHSKMKVVAKNGYAQTKAYKFDTPCFYLDEGNFSKEYAINNLTPKSLAIAYADDGSTSKLQNRGQLYSTATSKELTKLLSKKLLSIGIENKYAVTKSSSTKKSVYYIDINKKGLYNLCKIIAPYIHSNLKYKIIDEFKSLVGLYQWNNNWGNYYGAIVVKSEIGKPLPVYNLTVKDNHTYVLASKKYDKSGNVDEEGLIVHNCDLINPKSISSMYMKFFSIIKPIGIMGLTATPYRRVSKYYKDGEDLYYTSGMEMLNRIHPFFFTSIAYKIELSELINMGFLSPIRYYVQKADNKKLKVNTIGSDYTDKSLQIVSTERESKTIKAILYANETCQRSITFVPSVANARSITEHLKKFNVLCPTISAETPAKERASLLKDYRKGNFKHLINVGVFLVGLDVPEIDAIIWDRNTVHPRILYQGIGRGLRLDPKRPNKVLHVYDVSGSLFKTGAIEDFRVIKEDGFKDKLVGRVNGKVKTISGVPLFVQKLN